MCHLKTSERACLSCSVIRQAYHVLQAEGAHRRGSELAAVAVLTYAALAFVLYSLLPCFATGLLLGAMQREGDLGGCICMQLSLLACSNLSCQAWVVPGLA